MTVANLCNDFMVLAVFMLIGFFVRELIKPIQKLFIPASLVGGLILLVLGPQVINVATVPESFESMPSVLIDIVMASLVFGVSVDKKKIRSYLDYSCITMTAYGMQMGVGVGIGWLLTQYWPGLPKGWGVMGVFAFHGGHGTAAAAASAFENLGVSGVMAVGMVLSTLGLMVAMLVGMLIVNFGVRRGWGSYIKDPAKKPSYYYRGILPEEKRTSIGDTVTTNISISHLMLQFSWLLAAVYIGNAIFDIVGSYVEAVNGLPSVLHGIFGGIVLWKVLRIAHLDKYVDVKTIKSLSGFVLEIVIFSAMATLDLTFVSTYIIPVLIFTVILAVLTIPVIFGLSYKYYTEEWFEKACMAYGAAMGNTSTGLALARAIDPECRSGVGDTHGVYSAMMSWKDIFVGLTPAWLISGTALTMGVGIAMMVAFAFVGLMISLKKRN